MPATPPTSNWVDAVKRKYSNVELVEDLRTAQQKNMRTTLVLDPQITLGKLSGQTNHILLNAIVFNSEMKPVSRIQGYGRSTIPYPFWDINFRPAALQALNEFDSKLKSIDR